MDTPEDTGPSPRLRRAIPIFAVAITAVVVAGVLYLRPGNPAATVLYPSPSAVPTLSAQYSVDFDFITPSLGWALIAQPLPASSDFWIYRTSDGARHWEKQLGASAADQIPTFRFFDRSNGIVVTAPGSALRTSDGGLDWHWVLMPAAALTVSFADARHWYAFGASSPDGGIDTLMTTIDGGASWVRATMPAGAEPGAKGFTSSAFRPDGECWFGSSGSDADVLLSTDNGQSWRTVQLPFRSPPVLQPVPGEKFQPADVISTAVQLLPAGGVLVTVTDSFLSESAFVTFDRGRTWRLIAQPPSPTQYGDFAFLDSKHWWAFRFGYLFKTSDAGISWKETKVAPLLESWRYQPVRVIDTAHAWSLMFASGSGVAGAFALSMTSDGGASWQTVNLPQPG